MMVMMRKMREDEFEANFDDDDRNGEADVGFDVDFNNEINDGGKEYGDGDDGVVHGFGAARDEDVGFVSFAGFFEIKREGVFCNDAGY